jgi:hypothetical protein
MTKGEYGEKLAKVLPATKVARYLPKLFIDRVKFFLIRIVQGPKILASSLVSAILIQTNNVLSALTFSVKMATFVFATPKAKGDVAIIMMARPTKSFCKRFKLPNEGRVSRNQ